MAAVTTATITIKNKSTGFKRFLLFLEAPQLSHGPNGDVFHNVYQRSPKVQSGEHSLVEFQVDDRWFAVYGTSSNNDIGSPRVYTGDSVPVKPGPDGTVAVLSTSDGDPYWDDTAAQGKSTSTQGGFTIITDASFKTLNENNIFIGVGASDPKDSNNVIPVQTFRAEPNLNSMFFPKMKYYICTGEVQPGTVVDRTSFGSVLKVDFTGATIPKAVFTLDPNGNYVDDGDVNKQRGIQWEVSGVPAA